MNNSIKNEPTYLVWTPRIISQPGYTLAVRFNITPLSAFEWPIGNKKFYNHLLQDIGIYTFPTAWDVVAYRSRYHDNLNSSNWMDLWTRNWCVSVETDQKINVSDIPKFQEGYETDAFAVAKPFLEKECMNAFVLADFPIFEKLEHAIAAIQRLPGLEPQFEAIEVEKLFWQVQINLGPQPLSFFEYDTPIVDNIDNIIRTHGGWPTFEERISVLG